MEYAENNWASALNEKAARVVLGSILGLPKLGIADYWKATEPFRQTAGSFACQDVVCGNAPCWHNLLLPKI